MSYFLLFLAVAAVVDGSGQLATTVQLFEWSWDDVAAECEDFLGPKGFSSVQISPPMNHITGDEWWTRYQPVTYELVSRSGTESEFVNMVKRCSAVGVDIVVDAVINHMAAGSGSSIAGNTYGNRQYPFYGPQDFHHYADNYYANCAVDDYSNKTNVQSCDLVGLPDLMTSSDYVQGQIADYINTLYDYGVMGIRIDAAKHQDATELSGIIQRIPSSMFINQEVIAGAGEAVQPSMYFNLGHVTEFTYANAVSENIKYEGKMTNLQYVAEGYDSLMPSKNACAFLDNHDTQRNGAAPLTYKDGDVYTFTSTFMLAWPYGDNVRVMSSYYFTDTDAGPPSKGVEGGNNCGDNSNWVCEHRRAAIANMVGWRAQAQEGQVENWQVGNSNQIAFSRGGSFIALNRDSSEWSTSLSTGLPEGEYCNVLASIDNDNVQTCSTVTVDQAGMVSVKVPYMQAVALHAGAKKRSF